jgi:hypothetical protein
VSTETVTWTRTQDQLPDDEITVMINTPSLSEPVWLGYYEAVCWQNCFMGMLNLSEVSYEKT